jgi:predicted dehydrogenase
MDHTSVSRRAFIKNSAVAAAAMATPSMLKAQGLSPSPNERLRIGFIGVGAVYSEKTRSGGRCQTHIDSAIRLQNEAGTVEIAAICDVFNRYRRDTGQKIRDAVKKAPVETGDYREILNDPSIDAVVIATPDHWHARQTLDALAAGKHVYCEKPMTHSVQEALDVHKAWKESGLVMQVGVQSTALPVWRDARDRICNGQLGKVLQYQTEYFRNSVMGQWRYYPLAEDMTPKNVDWKMFLGTEYDLAPDMPFDRARFAQWRCYWDFGAGMFTDLFVHRTTSMLMATGLRFPARVVGAGGIYLEYDGRDVPDVATVVADYPEGVQGLVTATMCCGNTPIKQLIRGHDGSFVFGNGEEFSGYDFVAERPQVTLDSSIKDERIDVGEIEDTSFAHFKNFCASAAAGKPAMVNCSPELGAAAMVIVKLGSMSYQQGKVFHFDRETMTVSDGNPSWAKGWEKLSAERAPARHLPGWKAGQKGCVLHPKEYQKLAGPWTGGADPAAVPTSG